MVITLYSVVAIFLIPVAGYLSDRYGRKVVIIPSLVIAGVGGLLSGLAAWFLRDSYGLILAGRLLQGVGAAGAAPIVLPLVGDMFKSDEAVSRGLGLIETANTFGKVLSPILGAALALVTWYTPLLAIPLLCAISTVLVSFVVRTPKKAEQGKAKESIRFREFMKTIRQIFQQKGRWLVAIFAIGCICMFVVFGALFYLSTELEDKYHIHGIWKGLILAVPLGILCLGSYLTGKFIKGSKGKMKWFSVIGSSLQALAMVCAIWLANIYLLICAFILAGVGIGLCLPCLDSLITEGIDKKERGTVTSLYNSVRYIGVAAGPPLVSLLLKLSQQMVFVVISVPCIAAVCLSLFAIKPKGKQGTGEQQPAPSVKLFDQRQKI